MLFAAGQMIARNYVAQAATVTLSSASGSISVTINGGSSISVTYATSDANTASLLAAAINADAAASLVVTAVANGAVVTITANDPTQTFTITATGTGTTLGGAINSVLHVFRPTGFTLATEATFISADGFPYQVGPIQIVDSAVAKEVTKLTIPQASIDNLDLQIMADAQYNTISNFTIPDDVLVTVPSSGPYTVTVSALTTADQDCVAVVQNDTAPQYLTRVLSTGTPGPGQFKVGSSGVVTFNAAQAGQNVVLSYFKQQTGQYIGGTAPRTQYGTLSFSGKIKGTRGTWRIWIPSLRRTTGLNLSVTGQVQPTSLEYLCQVKSGFSLPYVMWKVAG